MKENSGICRVARSIVVGRWSATEHELFLQGLQKFGKDWKAIANEVFSLFQFHIDSNTYSRPGSYPCSKVLSEVK